MMSANGNHCRPRTAAAVLILLVVLARSLAAQENTASQFQPIGVQQCALCHYSGGNPVLEQFRVTQFVALDEAHRWLDNDSHHLAYLLIDPNGTEDSNQLARRICETLEIDVATFGDPANLKARDCLSCHAGWTDPAASPGRDQLRFGVQCESCHGNASQWARPENHQQASWRKIPPAEKWAKYGMRSLSQPVQRADVCFSCHIGSVPENKVVTHAMYAAGHPPLPSIELASHSASMGKHWRNLEEKGESFDFRQEYVESHHPYLKNSDGTLKSQSEDMSELRMLLVGGALALEHSVRLLHAQAAEASRAWPDFAVYDCAACHHELRIGSERQPLSIPLEEDWIPPGRPSLAVWPVGSSRLAAQFAGASDTAERGIRSLRTILAEKPFGLREKIADSGGAFATVGMEARARAEQLAGMPFGPAEGMVALRSLCEPAADYREQADFEAARQRSWAIEIVTHELRGKVEFATDVGAFDATLAQLETDLMLRLPNDARRQRAASEPADRITRERNQQLQAAANFDSQRFAQQLAQLRALLR